MQEVYSRLLPQHFIYFPRRSFTRFLLIAMMMMLSYAPLGAAGWLLIYYTRRFRDIYLLAFRATSTGAR